MLPKLLGTGAGMVTGFRPHRAPRATLLRVLGKWWTIRGALIVSLGFRWGGASEVNHIYLRLRIIRGAFTVSIDFQANQIYLYFST